MTIPRISVIIPVYNTEAYLRPLFDSLCRQTFTDFEIVVINDGSTDNSLDVISQYSSFFGPRLRIFSQENKGLSSTRNIGISRAKGKYISFIDSDDYISDSFYDILVKNINDDEDIISCGFTIERKGEFLHSKHAQNTCSLSGIDFVKDSLMQKNGASVLWNKLIKRELFDGFRFIDNVYFEDMYGCALLPLNAKKVKYIPDNLYVYRDREDSIMDKLQDKHAHDLAFQMDLIVNFLIQHDFISDMYFEVRYFLAEGCVRILRMYLDGVISKAAFSKSCSLLIKTRKEVVKIGRNIYP